ncbi:putative transposase [Pseudorhodobacter antarcticus]|jgi:putative transposase|uniref:Putative transposase n=1 Tax=Pseudorhodobacter antarcticus TaxID=1077947 RepID=A0A1H8HWY3_9RHOB|nr:transposase [Pseudorhodobacter antarcticus]SEN60406.1 putative transposase [Pseudorhodobacter antarcticus]
MPNYIRPKVAGATIFFTVNLAQRGTDLLIAQIDLLRWSVAQVRGRRPFAIDAWVVLPDHLHAIWTLPAGDHDFSTRWREIKAGFSRKLGETGRRSPSQHARGEAGIWQRRFWDHHIRSQADYAGHLAYCLSDPVTHGLARRAADWPYSSIQRDISQGRIAADWAGVAPDGRFGA